MAWSSLRRTPLRRVNPERRAKLRERAYGVHGPRVRALRCCVCAALPPSDPHHVRTKGATGGGDWRDIVPLCRRHHNQLDSPGWSQPAFERHYGVDMAELAALLASVADRERTECSAEDLVRRLSQIPTVQLLPMLRWAPVNIPKGVYTGLVPRLAEWLVEWQGAHEVGRTLDLYEALEEWRGAKT